MYKFNEDQIERSRRLHRLLGSEDFEPFLKELDERIERYKDLTLTFKSGTAAADLGNMEYRPRYKELQDLKNWINDEIESGGNELIRKNTLTETINASEK